MITPAQEETGVSDGPPAEDVLSRLWSGSGDDAPLVRRARQGDGEAMDQLVHRYYPRTFNLAYRLCGNRDDAQDLVSETFLRAFRSIRDFRGDAYFSTWLCSILKNVFLSERKKRRIREHASLDELVELDERSVYRQIEDPSPGPGSLAEQGEQAEVVHRAVAALPEAQRLLVALYHFQHRSYEEIAEIVGLPVGTVKSRLNRARLFLKGKLAKERDLLGVPRR